MNAIVAKSLLNSHTYSDYRNIVRNAFAEEKSTGNHQSEDLLHYTELNETRMNRLEKTILIPAENSLHLQALKNKYTWLVISEGWCGDAAQLLPVFEKMASVTENINLKIVFRDENPGLMNLFLTNGSQSIPKLIVLNTKTLDVLGNFGPRPKEAAELVINYKKEFGVIDETIKTNLQLWYLHDKGLSTQAEIIKLMRNLEQ